MALLLPTRRADGQDTLYKAVPLGTVRAETALPPQHRPTQRLFGGIVGRLDVFFTHERPERRLMIEQLLTHRFGRVTAPRPLLQECVDRRLDRGHRRLEGRPVDRPFAEQVPQPKDQATQCQEVRAPHPQASAAIHQRLEISDQMAPAQLVALGRQRQVGPLAIRPHNPTIGRAQEVAQARPVAAGRHIKAGGDRRDHGPAPAPVPGFLPARFIDIAPVGLLDGGMDGIVDRGQGRAARLLQRDHAPQADREGKEVVQQPGHRAMTEVVVAMQQGHGRGGARAKRAGRYVRRARRRDEIATPRAADRMIVVGDNLRAHDGQLPHILGLDRAGILAPIRQRTLAGRAGLRIVVAGVVKVIRVGSGTVVGGMPGLTTGLSPTRHPRGAWGCGWRVGRWRFGRVLRMLGQAGFEVGNTHLEVGKLLLLVSKLLLLLRQNGQERTDELAYRARRGRPVVWGETSRWRVAIHAASMPGVGVAVK